MRRERTKKMIKKVIAVLVLAITIFACVGCREADKVSYNVSKEADNFNVVRRVAVINVRSDKILFEMVGRFSLEYDEADKQLELTTEIEDGVYGKHFIGLNQWITYVVEDVDATRVDKFKYEINYLPESIVPFKVTQND